MAYTIIRTTYDSLIDRWVGQVFRDEKPWFGAYWQLTETQAYEKCASFLLFIGDMVITQGVNPNSV